MKNLHFDASDHLAVYGGIKTGVSHKQAELRDE